MRQLVLLFEARHLCMELRVIRILHQFQVLVGIKAVLIDLQETYGDVGAVVGHTLVAGGDI